MAEEKQIVPDSCNICTNYIQGEVTRFCLEHNVVIKNPTKSCSDFIRKELTAEEPNEKSI